MKTLLTLLLTTAALVASEPMQFAPFMRPTLASPGSFDDIPGLILWVDVTQATNTTYAGAPTNGSTINDIYRDLSPANHALQASTSIVYSESGGGADGNHPFLIMTNNCTVGTNEVLTNSTTFTVGVVMKPIGFGDGGPFWADADSATGGGANANVSFNDTVDNLSVTNAYNIANGPDLESAVNTRSANWQVLFMVSNGASSSIWLNGIQIASGTVGTSFQLNRGPSGLSGFGGSTYTGVNWCSIHFARGLVWGRALSNSEVEQASEICMDDFGFP